MNPTEQSIHEDPSQRLEPAAPGHYPAGKKEPLVLLAWAISFLMHPLPLPSLMFGLVIIFAPELMLVNAQEIRWQLMGLLFLTTFAIPALSVFTMRMFGNISSLTMTRREDRRLPFLFVTAIYLVITAFFFRTFPHLPFVNLAIAGITLSLIVMTAVSLYWKISAHGIAAGGVTGFMTGLAQHYQNPTLIYPLIILVLLSGAVMWARLYLQHHKPAEVWVGWFTGFIICLGIFKILYPYLE